MTSADTAHMEDSSDADTDTGTVPPSVVDASDTPNAPASTPSRHRSWLPWVIALLTTAALVVVTLQWLPLRAAENERIDVANAARNVVTTLTTWDARDGLDDTVADLADVGTDSFKAEVERFFTGPAGEELTASGAFSTAIIKDLFIQAIDGDEATVFAVVDQAVGTTTPAAGNTLPRRAVVDLVRQDGAWVATAVTVTDGVFTVPDAEVTP